MYHLPGRTGALTGIAPEHEGGSETVCRRACATPHISPAETQAKMGRYANRHRCRTSLSEVNFTIVIIHHYTRLYNFCIMQIRSFWFLFNQQRLYTLYIISIYYHYTIIQNARAAIFLGYYDGDAVFRPVFV